MHMVSWERKQGEESTLGEGSLSFHSFHPFPPFFAGQSRARAEQSGAEKQLSLFFLPARPGVKKKGAAEGGPDPRPFNN